MHTFKLPVRGNSDLSWKENDSKKINIKGIRRSLKKSLKKKCDWHAEGGQIFQTQKTAWGRLLAPKETR